MDLTKSMMNTDSELNKEEPVCRPCEEKNRLIEGSIVAGQVGGYGIIDKAKNLVSGIKDMVNEDYVDNLEYMRRKEICRGCPHRMNVLTGKFEEKKVSKLDKCMACDCFLISRVGKIRGKVWLKNQDCPLGKWKV
jgi:hypothetical protein